MGMSKRQDTHLEILGSKDTCASPKLIAACHVLYRLLSRAIHCIAYTILHKMLRLSLWFVIMMVRMLLHSMSSVIFHHELFFVYNLVNMIFWVLFLSCFLRWTLRDSNARPPPCKGGDLPTDLRALRFSLYFGLIFIFGWNLVLW